jgi:hypothetical protein
MYENYLSIELDGAKYSILGGVTGARYALACKDMFDLVYNVGRCQLVTYPSEALFSYSNQGTSGLTGWLPANYTSGVTLIGQQVGSLTAVYATYQQAAQVTGSITYNRYPKETEID